MFPDECILLGEDISAPMLMEVPRERIRGIVTTRGSRNSHMAIVARAMGIPTDMFTLMFALGRLPGWIAQWREMRNDPKGRINRPRQVYTGESARDWTPLDER